MSDCEEKIYSNDYVDFIISKDVLDVIDLSSDCIQRIDEEKDTYCLLYTSDAADE